MLDCLYLQKNRQANRYRPRTPWPVLLSPRQVSRCQYTCPWDLGEQQPLSHSGKLVDYTDSIYSNGPWRRTSARWVRLIFRDSPVRVNPISLPFTGRALFRLVSCIAMISLQFFLLQ